MICAYRRKINTKMFIFILISVILMLTLIFFSLAKAFHDSEEISKANIFSSSNTKIYKYSLHTKINKNQLQKNIPNSKVIVEQKPETYNSEHTNNQKRTFGSNVAFIGDSRTQAFLMYSGLKDVVDYTNIGLMVDTAITKKFITNSEGEKITILEDLKNRNIDTVYIMLGINELGWVYSSIFINKYEELIDSIRQIKPNCEIIIQSIIPVTKTKSDSDNVYNNTRITEYNSLIEQMANRKNIKYINLIPELTDKNGNLPENASPDGIHLNKTYCLKWLECLKSN